MRSDQMHTADDKLHDPASTRISILLFGPLARHANRDSIDLHWREGITAGAIIADLRRTYPDITAMIDSCRLAVNHDFAGAETPISPSDELALIGFVSGG